MAQGDNRLDGKVAVVTGGAQGIGAATVRRLSEQGAQVVALDLDESRAQEALGGLPTDSLAVGCDITDRAQVKDGIDRVVERFGRLDILVNNAGITRDNLFFKMSDDDWHLVLATHLTGSFHVTQTAQEHMVRNKWGRIVFLSSRSALGNRGQANYAVAKAGLQGLTRTLAIELGPFGITVNAVAPGFVETAMTRAIVEKTGGSYEDLVAAATERSAVKRVGQPEDIAAVVAFLASPDAGFVTGQTVYATGGPTV
jgi:3-oxoacyl-[acyl-carrier protein] reductase